MNSDLDFWEATAETHRKAASSVGTMAEASHQEKLQRAADLVVQALKLYEQERGTVKHVYPTHHGPGKSWAGDLAWECLDKLPPGAIEDRWRAMLAGILHAKFDQVIQACLPEKRH